MNSKTRDSIITFAAAVCNALHQLAATNPMWSRAERESSKVDKAFLEMKDALLGDETIIEP